MPSPTKLLLATGHIEFYERLWFSGYDLSFPSLEPGFESRQPHFIFVSITRWNQIFYTILFCE